MWGYQCSVCQRAKLDMSKASLAWLLQQENVPVAITGASTPEQVVQNIDIPTFSFITFRVSCNN
jgi:aryl-alcohol dehydrogenase-like predicted oxidoreductase